MLTRIFIILVLLAAPAFAVDEGKSGLPIPRFVTLKSEEANSRAGPGTGYPIKWVYKKKNLPVEITAEFGNWRKIRDFDGEEGWVLKNLLSGKRAVIAKRGAVAYSDYEGERGVLRFGKGVILQLKKCKKSQCEIEHDGIEGWVDRAKLWGVYDEELFD